jgi:hypothetical protein
MRRKSDGHATGSPPPTSYEVGYRKPPVHSQFQKGRSGNPRGRPKGAKGKTSPDYAERLKEIILEEAYRTIGVRDGVREVKVPMAQAIVRALAVNAVKGQQRSQRLFTELLTTIERERRRDRFEVVESLFDYKRAWDNELARRAALGIAAPDPIPHPDHIRIDFRTGGYEISGPLCKEEKTELEVWDRYRQIFVDANDGLRLLLEHSCFDEWGPLDIYEQLRGNDRCIDFIEKMLRSGRPMPLPILPEDLEI